MISELDLLRLYRAAPIAIILISRTGLIIENNPTASALLGRPISALADTPILRWIVERDRERSRRHFMEALRGWAVEWRTTIVRGNGALQAVSLRVIPRAPEKRRAPLVVFVQEVEPEDTWGEDLTQIGDLLENIPGQFIAITDSDGVLLYSRGLARTIWIDDDHLRGQELTTILSTDEENLGRHQEMENSLREGRGWDGVIWLKRADERAVPAQIHAIPYQNRRQGFGEGVLIVGRIQNILIDDGNQLSEERRYLPIGQLAVGIAYELGRPLTKIDHIVTDLQRQGGHSAELGQKLSIEVQRMDQLLSALRTFARDPELTRDEVSIPELINQVVAEERENLAHSGIELVSIIEPELPKFHLDSTQISAVLKILLENAREAFQLSEIGSGKIILTASVAESRLIIRCQDDSPDGEGEWIDAAFNPFFTTKADKIGLGLSIAQGIITEHGGDLWVARSPDGWTAFTIELPLESPSPSVTSRMAPISLSLGRHRTVLVIDHDSAIRALLRKFLERAGFSVREAWSGRSAIASIINTPPELVLTGLKMDEGSGEWLLERLAQDFPSVARRTVVVTADPSRLQGIRAVDELNPPILRKPIDFKELLEALDEISLRE